jgi:hypothetical protein
MTHPRDAKGRFVKCPVRRWGTGAELRIFGPSISESSVLGPPFRISQIQKS